MKTSRELQLYTQKTRQSLIDYYLNINLQTFKWDGLPDSVNIDYFERELFFKGKACFLKLNNMILSLGYNQGGNLNIYGESLNGIAMGVNETFSNKREWVTGGDNSNVELIACWDNKGKTMTFRLIDIMVDKLTQLYRTQDMLIQQTKKPYILSVPENQKLNVENLLKQIDTNTPYIVGNEVLSDIAKFEVLALPNNLQFIENITQSIITIDNLIRKYLGVYNNESNGKKERLIVDEVNANNNITDTMLYNRLEARQMFCDKVNKCFDLNVSVSLSDNIKGDEQNGVNTDKELQRVEREQ